MNLKRLVFVFVLLWLLSACLTLWIGDMSWASAFGDSFGAVNALFSGVALALAVYSMILQQRQSAEFEKNTIATLEQQARTIGLIEKNLVQQANVARVTALSFLIQRDEDRIESLKEWGRKAYEDENYYSKGIKAAQLRIDEYQRKIRDIGTAG